MRRLHAYLADVFPWAPRLYWFNLGLILVLACSVPVWLVVDVKVALWVAGTLAWLAMVNGAWGIWRFDRWAQQHFPGRAHILPWRARR